MTRPLRWTEQAIGQLGAIAEYISLSSPIYAEQVVERMVLHLRQVQQFPESGREAPEVGDSGVREVIETPYRLIYRVRHDVIEVVAVVHGRQDLLSHL